MPRSTVQIRTGASQQMVQHNFLASGPGHGGKDAACRVWIVVVGGLFCSVFFFGGSRDDKQRGKEGDTVTGIENILMKSL